MSAQLDLIFHGGDIVTMADDTSVVEAVGVADGRIVMVGALEAVRQHRGAATREIDLAGATLLPGFIEPHGHPLKTAMYRGTPVIDARPETTPTYAALMAMVRRRVAKAAPGKWLHFFGLDPQRHPDMREPTLAELDEIAPANPLSIQTSNAHALYANSLAFGRRGWDKRTPAPPAGIICLDDNGELTGKVEERAVAIFLEPMYAERGDEGTWRAFDEWLAKHIKAGITTCTEIGMIPGFEPTYERYLQMDDVPMRVVGYEQANVDGKSHLRFEKQHAWLDMVGVKLWGDGSPFVGNIAVTHPYLNNEITLKRMGLPADNTGHMNFTLEALQKFVPAYAAAGQQVATHVQGDRTIDLILDLYESIIGTLPDQDHRFRLEHCALMRDDQIERAKRLGVVCSFFPGHLYYWGEPLADYLFGEDVAARYMPIGSAAAAGMRFSLHSDAPMTDPNPLLCMQIATTRRTHAGRVLGQAQCISAQQALRAITIDAAYQLFMDDRIGSIEVGKYADFTILENNPLTVPPETLASIPVVATWVGGREIKRPT